MQLNQHIQLKLGRDLCRLNGDSTKPLWISKEIWPGSQALGSPLVAMTNHELSAMCNALRRYDGLELAVAPTQLPEAESKIAGVQSGLARCDDLKPIMHIYLARTQSRQSASRDTPQCTTS